MNKIEIIMSEFATVEEMHKLTENIQFAILNNGFKVDSVTTVVE